MNARRSGDADPAQGASGLAQRGETERDSDLGPVWPWVLDVAPAVTELRGDAWAELARFEVALRSALTDIPGPRTSAPGRDYPPGPVGQVGLGSHRLLALRRTLAPGTVLGPWGAGEVDHGKHGHDHRGEQQVRLHGALVQLVRQFIAGYRDVDLRDVTGPGHGLMILRHARREVIDAWAARLDAGDLVGTAMTEAAGGSRLRPAATTLIPDGHHRWRLVGAKRWISRLDEAAAFVVSAADTDGRAVAVLVDSARDGLVRTPQEPAGLGGWSWGSLDLDHVVISEPDLLIGDEGSSSSAMFARHFALYRLLVTATALGAAAGIIDLVARLLAERRTRGEIARVSDHALIALAAADSDVRAAWLNTLHTARGAVSTRPDIARSAAAKAHGVETARRAADTLAALAGAAGFVRSHPLAKARADLEALRFADGAHDAPRRHAGARLLPPAP